MPYRSFVDAEGTPWNVWDVRPQWGDRRVATDRRVANVDEDETLDPPVLERRRATADRRQRDSDGLRRVKLAQGMSAGWLTFEAAGERRRLSPIPPGWEEGSPADLADLCARAASSRPHQPPTS
jgi:hypothetical protein